MQPQQERREQWHTSDNEHNASNSTSGLITTADSYEPFIDESFLEHGRGQSRGYELGLDWPCCSQPPTQAVGSELWRMGYEGSPTEWPPYGQQLIAL